MSKPLRLSHPHIIMSDVNINTLPVKIKETFAIMHLKRLKLEIEETGDVDELKSIQEDINAFEEMSLDQKIKVALISLHEEFDDSIDREYQACQIVDYILEALGIMNKLDK
jgi:hypothetical protein